MGIHGATCGRHGCAGRQRCMQSPACHAAGGAHACACHATRVPHACACLRGSPCMPGTYVDGLHGQQPRQGGAGIHGPIDAQVEHRRHACTQQSYACHACHACTQPSPSQPPPSQPPPAQARGGPTQEECHTRGKPGCPPHCVAHVPCGDACRMRTWVYAHLHCGRLHGPHVSTAPCSPMQPPCSPHSPS